MGFGEIVIDIVCFEVAKEKCVIGEIAYAFGLRQNEKFRGGEGVVGVEAETLVLGLGWMVRLRG